MGYRRLLKRYIRHLELVAGGNFIERQGVEGVLEKRDLGELRNLAAEVRREAHKAGARAPDRQASASLWERSPDREPSSSSSEQSPDRDAPAFAIRGEPRSPQASCARPSSPPKRGNPNGG